MDPAPKQPTPRSRQSKLQLRRRRSQPILSRARLCPAARGSRQQRAPTARQTRITVRCLRPRARRCSASCNPRCWPLASRQSRRSSTEVPGPRAAACQPRRATTRAPPPVPCLPPRPVSCSSACPASWRRCVSSQRSRRSRQSRPARGRPRQRAGQLAPLCPPCQSGMPSRCLGRQVRPPGGTCFT